MNTYIEGAITKVAGFETAGVKAGVKYQNREDMALIYSTVPCTAAGVFTKNVVKAAPVLWDQHIVKTSASVQAIVVNTGIANAGTGSGGYEDAKQTAAYAAEKLGINSDAVLVASTGVIGPRLPMDRIFAGIDQLVSCKNAEGSNSDAAARAIMTTDTKPKQLCVTTQIGGQVVHVAGIAKGSGMIHPNMGTMLAFVATDAAISKKMLQAALEQDVVDTYNMISVDGDTSTNDTLLALANGLANNRIIDGPGEDFDAFVAALHLFNEKMAMSLAGDGEGATALYEAVVDHAASKEDARKLAKAMVCSSLCKAAIFGHDANWGRFLCALGYSGANFDPNLVTITFEANGRAIIIFTKGAGVAYSEEAATAILESDQVTVRADMGAGDYSATAWGCDLSYDYVKINADYRS